MLDFHEFTDVSKIMKIKHSEKFFLDIFHYGLNIFGGFA